MAGQTPSEANGVPRGTCYQLVNSSPSKRARRHNGFTRRSSAVNTGLTTPSYGGRMAPLITRLVQTVVPAHPAELGDCLVCREPARDDGAAVGPPGRGRVPPACTAH